jgi:CubicO group peptidase (beta-lactamase class C family)
MLIRAFLVVLLALPLAVPAASAQTLPPGLDAQLDRIFARYAAPGSPGCAVGVGSNGQLLAQRAFGLADLEHAVPNSPATIFEAGSVSKQFTAAAIVLLALDGALALDDDVRRHVPELPDYGHTLTIRHLLNHTSGLRDWGSVAAISGWGRGSRVHTHDHVLDIVSRQRALNYEPGREYSYTNTGYNLQAVIVERVSGMPFAEFSRVRLFEPLGLRDTQWRDDYRRIVPGRASAYAERDGAFELAMPYEDVHGNGGLLTTIADLVRWDENLVSGRVGGPDFLRLMHEQGVLNDGSRISYAAGLQIGTRNGTAEVSHTGATGGYRAFLARYPERALTVALLCNVATASPGGLGGAIADVLIPAAATAAAARAAPAPAPDARAPSAWQPSPAQLAEYAGEFYSPDAETTFVFAVDDGQLVLLRRPASRTVLRPVEPDAFAGAGGTLRFVRDGAGRITELSVSQARVFDLRFDRVTPAR